MTTKVGAWRVAALVMACALSGTGNAAVEKPAGTPSLFGQSNHSTAVERLQEDIQRAASAFEGADYPVARDLFDAILEDPTLDALAASQRAGILVLSGVATWETGDAIRGRDRFQAALRLDPDNPEIWQLLAAAEQSTGDRERASAHLASLLSRWPERVAQVDPLSVSDLVFEARKDSADRLALMRALFDAGYTRNERGASGTWRELALALLAQGDETKAREVVQRIDDPLVIVDLRSDRRFDAIEDVIASMPSVEDAAAADVERFRQRVQANPGRIDLAADLGTALLVAGRNHDALAQADATLAMIDSADPATLEHIDERIWVMNNRAVALRRLGRLEDAVKQMEQARQLSEGGTTNVSQSLNLGMLYCHMARPHDARRALETLGPMSDYGRMVETSVRQCIALLEGDAPAARHALETLSASRDDAPSALLDALMRAGDVEQAAAELVRQLRSDTSRDAALDFVHTYRVAPALPGTERGRATRQAVLARADVRAAIDEVGRAGEFGIHDLTGIE